MNVIGKRVVGNWGAGIPENEGTIYGIRDGYFAMVRWDDCEYAEPDSIFGSKDEYAYLVNQGRRLDQQKWQPNRGILLLISFN